MGIRVWASLILRHGALAKFWRVRGPGNVQIRPTIGVGEQDSAGSVIFAPVLVARITSRPKRGFNSACQVRDLKDRDVYGHCWWTWLMLGDGISRIRYCWGGNSFDNQSYRTRIEVPYTLAYTALHSTEYDPLAGNWRRHNAASSAQGNHCLRLADCEVAVTDEHTRPLASYYPRDCVIGRAIIIRHRFLIIGK